MTRLQHLAKVDRISTKCRIYARSIFNGVRLPLLCSPQTLRHKQTIVVELVTPNKKMWIYNGQAWKFIQELK